MTHDAISLLNCRGGARSARRAPSRSIIPRAARPWHRRAPSPSVISSAARNLSYGLSEGFSVGGVDFADGVVGFASAGFPTVKYLRILSSRFGPSPRIASKSSTLLKAPYDLRICKILSAVAGPIPGTCCSSSELAVFRFTGFAGGFFFPASTVAANIKPTKRKEERSRIANRRTTTAIYCSE
jgi:hypothetical protein